MSYTINQRNYFNRLSETGLNGLNIEKLSSLYYNRLAVKLVDFLQQLPESVNLDSPLSIAQQQEGLSNIFIELNAMMRLRFRSQINKLWEDAFDLGLKHQVEDILYNNKAIKRQWDKDFKPTRYDSVFSKSGNLVAKFSEEKDILRAEKEYQRLIDSIEKVDRSGKWDKLRDDEDVVGRYTPLERAFFLDSLTEISNIRRRAESSKFNYISDEYMKRRFRVLSEDFADKYDENTKKAIEKFLLKDVRYVTTLRNNNLFARNATDAIADTLEKQTLEVINDRDGTKKRKLDYKDKKPLYKRARAILRTETSLAYNIGKLIGYSSPEDIDKKFIWTADWELQVTKEGYVVCEACRSMHGKEFTAQKLLAAAMRSDTGIVNYQGTRRTKTDFKNPSIPVIPFHVNCSCRFIRSFDPQEEAVGKQEVAVPVTSRGLLRQTQTTDIGDMVLPKILGATLLVGGAFMLARSNVWKKVFTIAQNVKLPPITKSEAVLDAMVYVDDVIGGPAADITRDIVKDGIQKAGVV